MMSSRGSFTTVASMLRSWPICPNWRSLSLKSTSRTRSSFIAFIPPARFVSCPIPLLDVPAEIVLVQSRRKYKRILPKFERDSVEDGTERVGFLTLGGPLLGIRNHSSVRRAPLRPPRPLSAYGKHRMVVTVVVKRSFPTISARKSIRHEAKIFDLLPRYLQEEYRGYHVVSFMNLHPVPVAAVAPNYYFPVEGDGTVHDRPYADCHAKHPRLKAGVPFYSWKSAANPSCRNSSTSTIGLHMH